MRIVGLSLQRISSKSKSKEKRDKKSCQDYKWQVIVPYHTHSRSPKSSVTWA